MSEGMEALAEIARREAALVYGTTHREYKQPPLPTEGRATVASLRAEGLGIAAIALRLGYPRNRVAAEVHRLEAAS